MTCIPRPLALAIVAAPLMLAGCGGGSGSDGGSGPAATQTITVTPSLGKISNARVKLHNAATGAQIGDIQALNADGSASFTVPQSQVAGQPVVAEVLPAATGDITYIDEADNLSHTIAVDAASRNTPILHAAINPTASTQAVGVTALTEAAFQQLPAAAMTAKQAIQAINNANANVKAQLGLGFDITTAPVLDYSALVNAAIEQSQRAYAAYLAALARQASQLNAASQTPAYDIARSIAADLSDGNFNGSANGAALPLAYNNAFIQQWQTVAASIVSHLAAWNDTAAFDAWYAGVKTTIDQAGGYTVPKILHPAMVRTYFGKVVSTTPTGVPARTPCSVSLNAAGVLSVHASGQLYSVTIPASIIDADSDMTQDGNRIKPAGAWMTTWGGRAHAAAYGIGWAHYTNSNTADGPVSTSILGYANGRYGNTVLVCDTYSTNGGAASAGDGAYGATEVGSDGSLVAASVKAELVTGGRKETWTDPAYGTLSVNYGAGDRTISNITVTRGSSSFSCSSTQACSGAVFSAVNKIPSLVLSNVSLSGLNGTLSGVLVEAADAENPTSGNSGYPLSVTGYTPDNGAVGATVTINGTGFDANPSNLRVRFNGGANAVITASTATTITTTVPQGAISGGVTVTNTVTNQTYTGATFTVSAGGGSSLTINSAACTSNAFCGSGVISDFPAYAMKSITGGSSCSLSKSGGAVTLTSGGNSITTTLNGDAGDSLVTANGVVAVYASDVSGNTVTATIQIHLTNGVLDLAIGSAPGGVSILCKI